MYAMTGLMRSRRLSEELRVPRDEYGEHGGEAQNISTDGSKSVLTLCLHPVEREVPVWLFHEEFLHRTGLVRC